MSIITNPESNQQSQELEDVAGWSRLSVLYGIGMDEIRIQTYFHPVYKPLKFYLNGEEAVMVPVSKTANKLEVTDYATRYRT